MFNLRRSQKRERETQEGCTSPPPGTDSAFGVRSLNGSVAWEERESSERDRDERSEQRVEAVEHKRERQEVERDEHDEEVMPGTRGSSGSTIEASSNLIANASQPIQRDTTNHTSRSDPTSINVDSTPLPFTLPLPDPFAPSPPSSPHSPRSANLGSSAAHSPSLPLPVNSSSVARIAHAGQGIIWAPSSPDETLHPLSLSHTSTSGQGLASLVHPRPTQLSPIVGDSPNTMWRFDDLPRALSDLEHLDRHLDRGTSSGHSSPASFTSLPSYVGSMSSLSRASSPVSGISGAAISRETSYSATNRFAGLHEREYSGEDAEGGSRSQELVLPTLSLPSSSLHLILPKWPEAVSAAKVTLLGEMDKAQGVVRALESLVELVEVDNGVGVVKEGKVVLVLSISQRAELVKRQVLASYSALSRLLHPHPPEGSEKQLWQLVAEHARRFPWIHALYDIDGTNQNLSKLVPIIAKSLSGENTPVSNPGDTSPVLSPINDPTPMPGNPGTSYFPTAETPSDRIAAHLVDLLSTLTELEDKSIDAFLAHRSRMTDTASSSLEASITSADSSQPFSAHSAGSANSGSTDPAPMPTVARVSGGGEWEAGLSRRLAAHLQRKEHDLSPRSRKARRVKKRGCVPLFPGGPVIVKADSSIWRVVWRRLFGPWIPSTIMDPSQVEMPIQEKDTPAVHHIKPRRWAAWQWGLGAVVVAGVGLLVARVGMPIDAYTGAGLGV